MIADKFLESVTITKQVDVDSKGMKFTSDEVVGTINDFFAEESTGSLIIDFDDTEVTLEGSHTAGEVNLRVEGDYRGTFTSPVDLIGAILEDLENLGHA